MNSFFIGLFVCLCAAGMFAALVFVVRRMDREPVLDVLDYDNAHPDGWVEHFREDRQ